MSAAITVFTLSELVEQILYHATLADILRSQRVNTTFKHVIDETPRLQEKLFFRAIRPYDSKGSEVEAKCNEHEEVSATGAVTEWRTEGKRTRGLHRYLNKKENPALLKALKKLVVEMRKQSRILSGVAHPNDLLEEATASGETGGEVELALRLAASPNV
nr:hypothetical protein B0A51_08474 [Rachicladosporium sp. CCFEE 5018]